MNKKIILITWIVILFYQQTAFAYTIEHHLINMGRDALNVLASPIKAIFFKGPQDIKRMWQYEVYGKEKPQKRGLWRYRLYALWRAPAVELKAGVDGVVQSITYLGSFSKELLSIFFGD
ncbi:MAG: hypothetical protein N2606_07385 [Candidatus Omnitrophica bacterium]|nr:hypothetical protein [Candidatus Omnitrophota bacterium]